MKIYQPRFTSSCFGGEYLTVMCPICDYDFVWFGHPEWVDGKDDYLAWEGRGNAVRVPFTCENGEHRFNLVVGFHKGNSHLFMEAADEV